MGNIDYSEARMRKEVTEKSDIYGMGVVLIELLTGRSAGEEESMVEWARYCYSECHLDTWVDPMMKGGYGNGGSRSRSRRQEEVDVVETMNLALHCTATDPTARPCASHVYKTLSLSAVTCRPTVPCVSAFTP